MTHQDCLRNCIFSVNGVCRLKHTQGLKEPQCPYREGSQAVMSVL